MIGHLPSETNARTFSDYLYVQGIENQIEPDHGGPVAIWVHNEDEVEKARQLLFGDPVPQPVPRRPGLLSRRQR
jgi:hypothetical protein